MTPRELERRKYLPNSDELNRMRVFLNRLDYHLAMCQRPVMLGDMAGQPGHVKRLVKFLKDEETFLTDFRAVLNERRDRMKRGLR